MDRDGNRCQLIGIEVTIREKLYSGSYAYLGCLIISILVRKVIHQSTSPDQGDFSLYIKIEWYILKHIKRTLYLFLGLIKWWMNLLLLGL